MNAPLIPIIELDNAESLSKYGNVGYQTKHFNRLILVKIIGYIVDVIDNDERGFTFLRVDDGTASILLKIFGERSERRKRIKGVDRWDYVLVLGFVRHWGEEIYIQPINIKKLDIQEEIYYKLRLIIDYYAVLAKNRNSYS